MKLEHIGIAVNDAAATAEVLERLLGLKVYKTEDVATESVRTKFISDGTTKLELVQPTSENAALAKHIATRGEGLHHLAFEVEDIEQVVGRMRNQGFRVLSDSPYAGADGKSVFFIHPKDSGRVLFEFCESRRSTAISTTVSADGQSVQILTSGNSSGDTVIVCGGDPVSKYLRTLEPLLELVFVDDDTILSQALIDAINFKRGGYHLLVHADQIESRREQLAGLSPSSSVFLVDDFQTIPDHLPGNNVLLIGSSKRLRALSAGRLQRLLDRPSTDVAILPQFPHAQELLGQSIAAYLTAGSRKPTTSTSETS